MNNKIIYVDIDGTICNQTNSDYENAVPYTNAVNKINKLYEQGNKIVIYTSRYMKTSKDDVEKAHKLGYEFTLNQLNSWGLKFHELKMGKPQYDILIDDKAFNYNKSLTDIV